MRIMPEVTAAAQASALNPEWWQVVILVCLLLVGGIAVQTWIATRALMPSDSPETSAEQDRASRLHGWVLVAVLAAETTIALTGALGVL